MESQIRLRGYDPTTALIILKPRQVDIFIFVTCWLESSDTLSGNLFRKRLMQMINAQACLWTFVGIQQKQDFHNVVQNFILSF